MENPRSEKEKIIKDIRNHFRREKELSCTVIKNIRNLFRPEKETEPIKDRIIRGIKILSEHEEGNYYVPGRVNNFWSNSYIGYESNSDRNKI